MKKITKLFASLVLATFAFVGCSNQLIGTTVEDPNAVVIKPEAGQRTVTINVTGDSNQISFSNGSSASKGGANRSILPEAVDATTLKYYLVGTNTVTNKTLTDGDKPEEMTFKAKTGSTEQGTVERVFEKSAYNLILAAVSAENEDNAKINRANLIKYASFIAYADVDFRYNESVSFYLIPNMDSTAQAGKVSLTVYALGWDPANDAWKGYSIKSAGIYSLTDDTTALLTSSTFTPSSGSGTVALTTLPKTKPDTPNFAPANGLPAGTYNFTITFTDGTQTYNYSEDIVIFNNQTTKANVEVLPTIGRKPLAPSDFSAGYIDPTTDIENAEYYNVVLKWKDNAVNENYYEIQTLKVNADNDMSAWHAGKWDTDDDWNDYLSGIGNANFELKTYNSRGGDITYGSAASIKTIKYNAADDNYSSGSLTKSNTTITLKYALGTRYIARIRAVNDAGVSAWNYVNITGGSDFASGAKAFPTGSLSINRYKLSYNLNGGKFENDTTPATKLITFHTQGSTAILNPKDPEAGSTLALYIEDSQGKKNYWTKWQKADNSDYNAEKAAPAAYTGFKNLSLFAYYNASTTADVTIYNIAKYEIKDTMLKIIPKESINGEEKPALTVTDKYTTVDISSNKTLVFKLETTPANFTYDMVKVSIKKSGSSSTWTSDSVVQDSNGIASVTKDITSYVPGSYLVTYYAYMAKNATPYTYYILLEVVESGAPATPPAGANTFAGILNISPTRGKIAVNYTGADVTDGTITIYQVDTSVTPSAATDATATVMPHTDGTINGTSDSSHYYYAKYEKSGYTTIYSSCVQGVD